jgi:hypothetical protein
MWYAPRSLLCAYVQSEAVRDNTHGQLVLGSAPPRAGHQNPNVREFLYRRAHGSPARGAESRSELFRHSFQSSDHQDCSSFMRRTPTEAEARRSGGLKCNRVNSIVFEQRRG